MESHIVVYTTLDGAINGQTRIIVQPDSDILFGVDGIHFTNIDDENVSIDKDKVIRIRHNS